MVEWFLSAPHLKAEKQASHGYPAIELWALGFGFIIQTLLRIYKNRRNDDMKDSVMLAILEHWISNQDGPATDILIQTRSVMMREYQESIANQIAIPEQSGSGLDPAQLPGPVLPRERSATPFDEMDRVESASRAGRDAPDARRSVTRSMTKHGPTAGAEKRHLKRVRDDSEELELPTLVERTEFEEPMMKRKRT